jgi:uncharacterized protein YjbI with pentapeptide repeats
MKSGTSPKLAADHIEKASFFEAPFSLANLSVANLSGADLSGANLSGAKNLTQEQLDKACGNGRLSFANRGPLNTGP